ncbi:unnamed protein product [Caenorhabditis auriculariae]|uniref:VWFA domain-containing protein n=1 Tax=Caenorhabditis auriculariae TaxID=2777116 RepID=A0A8S1H5R6_9PELO|nr:unnamed protein product [Caenorhabditis auriculariae]
MAWHLLLATTVFLLSSVLFWKLAEKGKTTSPAGAPTFIRSLSCDTQMLNWTSFTDEGVLSISTDIYTMRNVAQNDNFVCYYAELIPENEMDDKNNNITLGPEKRIEPLAPVEIPFVSFAVLCRDPSETVNHLKTFVNFPSLPFQERGNELAAADPLRPSLAILALGQVTYNQFLWRLPRLQKLRRDLGFVDFQFFNQISGDPNENFLTSLKGVGDDQSSIWTNMRDRGCVTFLNDDQQLKSPFGSSSARNPEFDYHPRAYHLYNQQNLVQPKGNGHCMMDGRLNVEDYFRVWRHFLVRHQKKCHFSITYLSDVSGHEDETLGLADDVIVSFLNDLNSRGILNSTAVVILSDGKSGEDLENNQGVFMVRMPDSYKDSFSEKISTLDWNSKRLISNLDVFETLRDISLPEKGSSNSLLSKKLSKERTCQDAGIDLNQCLCRTNVYLESTRREVVKQAVEEVIKSEFSPLKCIRRVDFPDSPAYWNVSIPGVSMKSPYKSLVFIELTATVEAIPRQMVGRVPREPLFIDFSADIRFDSTSIEAVLVGIKAISREFSSFDRICEELSETETKDK